MGEITTVGIDLAKNVFSVHGVDAHGKTVLRKTVSRGALLELMAQLPRCLVGMEACSGAHQLARDLQPLGHRPRIMMPKFIIPYRRNQKNDGNDAAAICEAVARPNMRFVPIKSVEQQAVLVVHRVRKELVELRNGQISQPGPQPAGRVRGGHRRGPLPLSPADRCRARRSAGAGVGAPGRSRHAAGLGLHQRVLGRGASRVRGTSRRRAARALDPFDAVPVREVGKTNDSAG